MHVAAEKAAHEIEPFRAAAPLFDGERELTGGHASEEPEDFRPIGTASHSSRDRHHVGIALRKHQDVAGLEPHGSAIRQPTPARAVDDDMIGKDVLDSGEDGRRQRRPVRNLQYPRRRGLRHEEHGPGESHCPQDLG